MASAPARMAAWIPAVVRDTADLHERRGAKPRRCHLTVGLPPRTLERPTARVGGAHERLADERGVEPERHASRAIVRGFADARFGHDESVVGDERPEAERPLRIDGRASGDRGC